MSNKETTYTITATINGNNFSYNVTENIFNDHGDITENEIIKGEDEKFLDVIFENAKDNCFKIDNASKIYLTKTENIFDEYGDIIDSQDFVIKSI